MFSRYLFVSSAKEIRRRTLTSIAVVTGLLPLAGTTLALDIGDIVEGPAVVVSGDSLYIGEESIQILGIVAPNLANPYGEVAKGLLSFFTSGRVARCTVVHIADNERAVGRCVSCKNGVCWDLAEEMLKSGHANTVRRSLEGHPLEQIYIHLETQARIACRGKWITLPECQPK